MADLSRAVSIEDLRDLARRRLPRAIFDFFDGGAEDEVTLRENRAAFERVRLLPKVLVNVAQVDMATELFGVKATLRLTTEEETGAEHCQHDNPTLGQELMLDWLCDVFGLDQRRIAMLPG